MAARKHAQWGSKVYWQSCAGGSAAETVATHGDDPAQGRANTFRIVAINAIRNGGKLAAPEVIGDGTKGSVILELLEHDYWMIFVRAAFNLYSYK